jgi:hypothetical protein
VGRFLTGNPKVTDLVRLLRTLIQNAGISLAELDAVKAKFDSMTERLRGFSDVQVVHGKDLVSYLSSRLKLDSVAVEAMVFLSIAACLSEVRQLPALREAEAWVRN